MQKKIADLIEKASRAASHAPEHLQQIAFSKAFDLLSGARKEEQEVGVRTGRQGVSKEAHEVQDTLTLEDLDRTRHSVITHGRSALENAMLLLRAAKDDLYIDGLSASDIAKTLTEEFRCSVSRRAVGNALNGAGRLVNRRKEGNTILFRLMAPGYEELDRILAGGRASSAEGRGITSKPKSEARGKPEAKRRGTGKAKSTRARSYGPGAAVKTLVQSGYFKEPRTIGEIATELKDNRGRKFKSNELSPVLLRQVQSGSLVRERNADNQYEYKQA